MTVTLKQVDTVCCGGNDKEVHDVMSVSVLVVILYNLNLWQIPDILSSWKLWKNKLVYQYWKDTNSF